MDDLIELRRMGRDYNELREKVDDLGGLFAFIEQQAKDSRYGVTIEWVVGAEGEAYGFSFGRQRYIGPPVKSAIEAIRKARADLRALPEKGRE